MIKFRNATIAPEEVELLTKALDEAIV
jgi:hypothetical protein